MSSILDIPAALVASPRPCAPAAARRHADDAQPRLRTAMPAALMTWRRETGTGWGYGTAVETEDGRGAFAGSAYVGTTKQHSIRSGPPTSRPPA